MANALPLDRSKQAPVPKKEKTAHHVLKIRCPECNTKYSVIDGKDNGCPECKGKKKDAPKPAAKATTKKTDKE
jgi:hypothetical protein